MRNELRPSAAPVFSSLALDDGDLVTRTTKKLTVS